MDGGVEAAACDCSVDKACLTTPPRTRSTPGSRRARGTVKWDAEPGLSCDSGGLGCHLC